MQGKKAGTLGSFMKASVAVTGSSGQLGRELCRRLGEAAIPLTRDTLDLADPESTAATLVSLRPRVVINCAAWTAVDAAESEPDRCFRVNATAVESLASVCGAMGCLLVQISTDYVFGADTCRREPYRETDVTGPVSVYGASKLAGEEAARWCHDHLVIRTCGLYSRSPTGPVRGRTFADTMIVLGRAVADRLPGAPAVLRVVDDQHVTPSYVPHVADAILRLIDGGRRGTFHVVNAGATTWHGFATRVLEAAGIDIPIKAIPSSEYTTPARRPGFSVLSTARLATTGIVLPPWQDGVAAHAAVDAA